MVKARRRAGRVRSEGRKTRETNRKIRNLKQTEKQRNSKTTPHQTVQTATVSLTLWASGMLWYKYEQRLFP